MFFSALKPKRPTLLFKRGRDENQVLIGWTHKIFLSLRPVSFVGSCVPGRLLSLKLKT